jgi:hypothetical protein
MKALFLLLCLLIGLTLSAPRSIAASLSGTGYQWAAGVFAVPLEIKDNAGVDRLGWPVTSGVPLPEGVARDPGELRLTDAAGREIPCQFTPLARYWGKDRSLRWVLLDFQVDLPGHGRTTVWLRNDRPALPVASPLIVREEAGRFVVHTGPLRAAISKRSGRLFDWVQVGGHTLLQARGNDGPVLRSGEVRLWERFRGRVWNNAGWDHERGFEDRHVAEAGYRSGPFRPQRVEVESAGPLRAVIAIHARHYPPDAGDGIVATGLYDTTTRLHFYRGRDYVTVEHTLAHADRVQPQRQFMFRAAGLEHGLTLAGPLTVTVGGKDAADGTTRAQRFALPPDTEAWLYQEEAGKGRPGRFVAGTGKDAEVFPVRMAGAQGRFLDLSDAGKGLAVTLRDLWREAPRAIALSAASLAVWLHADAPGRADRPGRPRPAYDLDFGERSSHEVLFHFHRGGAEQARVREVAEAFEYPLFARAPPAWYSDCEVWPFEIARAPLPPKAGGDDHWKPDRVLWNHRLRVSGVDYNSGGHHDSLSSSWLPYLRSGQLRDLERLLAESRWHMLRNPGWAYRGAIPPDKPASGRMDDYLADWDRLAGFGPKDFYLWRARGPEGKVRGGATYLNHYKALPDAEHYALFQLFEYWHLTGDRRALPAIHGFVNWALNYQHKHLFRRETRPLTVTDLFRDDPDALRRGHYARIYAWMLHTTLAGYQATGHPAHNEFALWQLRRMLALLRHRHGQLTRWDARPSDYLPLLTRWERVASLDALFEGRELGNWDSRLRTALGWFGDERPPQSRAKTWMEAKGVFALHEAYRTYGDERILDGIWGLADYFSHHVLFYPRLGMINHFTGMPSDRLGEYPDSLSPQRHDRVTQVWPLLYHYTGWEETRRRYASFERARVGTSVQDRFLQTHRWEGENRAKRSRRPPDAVNDLRVVRTDADGIVLAWTSPRDDGPSGRAERYFVKYSDKPIAEFAPTDHPMRAREKTRLVEETEEAMLRRSSRRGRPSPPPEGRLPPEQIDFERWHPEWHSAVGFWMAEHVAGEPRPGAAGGRETFVVRTLTPHSWLGAPRQPGLGILESGKTYYFALCSWDEDRNLSRLSNVVSVRWP